jgi:general secretion pathway protein G
MSHIPRGFTFVELLVTLAILGALASIALPLAEVSARRAKEAELRTALRQLRLAIDAYKRASDEGRIARTADGSGYPPRLSALVEGVRDAKSDREARIYFLRRLPRDPMADADLPAERTWFVRSYESPPGEPREGKDVYDVFSRSERVGLNGIRYNQW